MPHHPFLETAARHARVLRHLTLSIDADAPHQSRARSALVGIVHQCRARASSAAM
jgi:hypothetical protein